MELARFPKMRPRTKYINQMHCHFRSYACSGDIEMFHINTRVQVEDMFTKPLPKKKILKLRLKLIGFWEVDGVLTNSKDCHIIVSNFTSDQHYVKEGVWKFNSQPTFLCVNSCAYVDMHVMVTFESCINMIVTFENQGRM